MPITKAKLTIVLKADETVVAEIENPRLWQRVLAAINSDTHELPADAGQADKHSEVAVTPPTSGSQLARFAKTIGIAEHDLAGALDPKSDAPYLHLNIHCWEAMKKQTPKRGPGAVSPTALAGTLLCLWFRESGLGNPTQSQALEVLGTIGIEDRNSSRGVRSAKWLQSRSGGAIILNPAEVSTAIGIAKSFCLKKWSIDADRKEGN